MICAQSLQSCPTLIDDLTCKAEIETQTERTNVWTLRGQMRVVVMVLGGWWWKELGDWDRHVFTTMYMKQITNENLLYCTGNSTQHSVVT